MVNLMRLALGAAVAALLMPTVGAESLRFAVAIVRLDGGVVPFAAYEDGQWDRAWPQADEGIDASATMEDTPSIWRKRGARVPAVWHVWPTSGGSPIDARVTGIDILEAHCSAQVALTTNLPPRKGDHALKFGVAVDSEAIPIAHIDEVQQFDALWTRAERTVRAHFAELERAEASKNHQRLPEPSSMRAIGLTALYAERSHPFMYFVAERGDARTPSGCGPLTIITGWLVQNAAGQQEIISPKVFVTDCDAKEVRTALPLGAFHLANRYFWILQEHGYEDETYIIADIQPTDVRYVIDVNGGGC